MEMMTMTKSVRGFTLTELAVVIVIVSLLMGGLLVPLSAQREMDNRRQTNQQLATIRDALVAFATVNGRLPCPDVNNDGIEESSCSGNAAQDGILPWKSLALAQYDAWGGSWYYRVERDYASSDISSGLPARILKTTDSCPSPNTSNNAFPNDCITLYNNANVSLNTVAEHPIAIIYSTGPNLKADGYNASYEAGRSSSPSYQSDVPGPAFDDILIWVNRSALIGPLLATGRTMTPP